MMETYADLLKREKQKIEKKMTNYDYEGFRNKERKADYDGALGQTDALEDFDEKDEPEIKPHQTKIDEVNDIWTARRSDEDMTEKRAQFAQDLIDHESKVEIKLDDADLLHLAKAAHERDITLNQLCRSIIKGAFSDLDYRFEHQSQPSLLKEY